MTRAQHDAAQVALIHKAVKAVKKSPASDQVQGGMAFVNMLSGGLEERLRLARLVLELADGTRWGEGTRIEFERAELVPISLQVKWAVTRIAQLEFGVTRGDAVLLYDQLPQLVRQNVWHIVSESLVVIRTMNELESLLDIQ